MVLRSLGAGVGAPGEHFADMAMIGAAAAAQDREVGMLAGQSLMQDAEFFRITIIQLGAGVELFMRHARRIGANALQTIHPCRLILMMPLVLQVMTPLTNSTSQAL